MASLVKRSGKWWVKLYDHTGRQKWHKGYTDKSETQKLANRLENEKTAFQRGDLDPQHELRKAERAKPAAVHIDAHENALKARGNRKYYITQTVRDIRTFFTFAGLTHAAQVQRTHLDTWVMDLKANPALNSPRTINRWVGAVQSFLRWCKELGAVSEYVLFKYTKQNVKGTDRRKRRALAPDEAAKLLAAAPADRAAVYRFALLTGFRWNEAASLTPAAVRFDHATITVNSKDPRHNDRTHVIPLHPELVADLKPRCEEKAADAPVFDIGRREDAARLVKAGCKAAGVDTTHVDFHALRRTFVTRLAEGMVHPKILQQLARHSSLEPTLGYYTHFKQADERNAIAGLSAGVSPVAGKTAGRAKGKAAGRGKSSATAAAWFRASNHLTTSNRRQRVSRPSFTGFGISPALAIARTLRSDTPPNISPSCRDVSSRG